MSRQNFLRVGLLLGLTSTAPLLLAADARQAVVANSDPSIELRLLKLERQSNNQTLLELLDRIDSLQAELQEMRALSEEQMHQIDTLKQRQRDLYLDLDRRISRTEREGSIGSPVSTPAQGAGGNSVSLVSGSQPQNRPLVGQQQPLMTNQNNSQLEEESPALVEERAEYQKAFNLLRQLQYDPATDAFKRFIKKYPNGRYAHIAQYWLGEASYARRDFQQAIVDYQLLIDHYPQSPKVAEAMLKMGYSRWELKAVIGAKTILEQLVSKFPNSPEAKQGQPLLDKLNKRLNK